MQTIQVRPARNPHWQKQGGWEVYEGDGVSPVFCGANGREDAISYARQRAGYAPTEIQLLDNDWKVASDDFTRGRAWPDSLLWEIAEQ